MTSSRSVNASRWFNLGDSGKGHEPMTGPSPVRVTLLVPYSRQSEECRRNQHLGLGFTTERRWNGIGTPVAEVAAVDSDPDDWSPP